MGAISESEGRVFVRPPEIWGLVKPQVEVEKRPWERAEDDHSESRPLGKLLVPCRVPDPRSARRSVFGRVLFRRARPSRPSLPRTDAAAGARAPAPAPHQATSLAAAGGSSPSTNYGTSALPRSHVGTRREAACGHFLRDSARTAERLPRPTTCQKPAPRLARRRPRARPAKRALLRRMALAAGKRAWPCSAARPAAPRGRMRHGRGRSV